MTILFDDVNVFYNHSDPVSSFIAPRFSRPPKKNYLQPSFKM